MKIARCILSSGRIRLYDVTGDTSWRPVLYVPLRRIHPSWGFSPAFERRMDDFADTEPVWFMPHYADGDIGVATYVHACRTRVWATSFLADSEIIHWGWRAIDDATHAMTREVRTMGDGYMGDRLHVRHDRTNAGLALVMFGSVLKDWSA